MSGARRTNGRRCHIILVMLASLTVLARDAGAAEQTDSTAIDWTILFACRIELTHDDVVFPWNDPEALSQRNDRLVSMLGLKPLTGVDIFLKGSSGYRRERGGVHRNRFALAQGHVGFDLFGGGIRGRLFLRERYYRTCHELLPLVSNDAPFLYGRGQGLSLDVRDSARRIHIRYTESMLRSEELSIHGGLPLFRGDCS